MNYPYKIDVIYVMFYEHQPKFMEACNRLLYSLKSIQHQHCNITLLNASPHKLPEPISDLNLTIIEKQFHRPKNGDFNKSLLINYLVKNYVKTPYFICSDIDIVYTNNYIEKMFEYVLDKSTIYRVSPLYKNIEGVNVYTYDVHILDNLKGGIAPAPGNGLIHLESFMTIKGYDENYSGHSPEDSDLNTRLEYFGNTLISTKKCCCYHLPHFIYRGTNEKLTNYMSKKKENWKDFIINKAKTWGEYK